MAANVFFRYDTWVKSSIGPAVAGAQIYVTTQPSNATSAPPSPLAAIYSDSGGLVPITQPIITDGFGHADFYALPGLYTLVVALGGIVQNVTQTKSLGGVGTTGGGGGTPSSTLIIQANGVQTANQALLNLASSDASITITDEGNGTVNLQGAPQATAPYMFSAGLFSLTGINPPATSKSFTDLAERVYFMRFSTPYALNFSKFNFTGGSNLGGGSNASVGLYNSTGSTQLWTSGLITVGNVSDQNFTVVPPSPLVVPPGTYILAWTANDAGNASAFGWDLSSFVYASGTSNANLVNQSPINFGYASNAGSGGLVPASLGTFNLPTALTLSVMPAFFFQT